MGSSSTKNTIYFLVFAVSVYIFAGLSACNKIEPQTETPASDPRVTLGGGQTK